MANTEKINFNISAVAKKDIERLASSHGKNISVFMQDVCTQLIKANADRIKAQAEREKDPINFGGAVEIKPKKTKRKLAKSDVREGGTNE